MSSILYGELRRQAARCLRGARPGDTLQTTGLVHETFIRLAGAHNVDWQDRKHFLAVAGRTMRRVLVDLAREQGSAKRGSRAVHLPLDSGVAAGGPPRWILSHSTRRSKPRGVGRTEGAGGRAQVFCRADGRRDRQRPQRVARHGGSRLAHGANMVDEGAQRGAGMRETRSTEFMFLVTAVRKTTGGCVVFVIRDSRPRAADCEVAARSKRCD